MGNILLYALPREIPLDSGDVVIFNFEDKIGYGSFGFVYRGERVRDRYPVAVKLIKKSFFEQSRIDLYTRMDDLLSLPLHMNILSIKGVYEYKDLGFVYLVMDLCEGMDLFTFMKNTYSERFPTENEVRKMIKPLLEGLSVLHSSGWIHGDIKPENLIFASADNSFESLKLVDIEALIKHNPDQDGFTRLKHGFVFTPNYAAPEIYERKLSQAADMRAVGCIVYLLLEGQLPHENIPEVFEVGKLKTLTSIIEQLEIEPKYQKKKNYSKLCESFMRKLMHNNPKLRFQNAMEALYHPWIRGEDADNDSIINFLYDKFLSFFTNE